MALKKEIIQDDGVITNYHRILNVNHQINSHVEITVISYVSSDSRTRDILCPNRPYKRCITYGVDYKENMTVQEAYNYIKTLPEFEGAEDI